MHYLCVVKVQQYLGHLGDPVTGILMEAERVHLGHASFGPALHFQLGKGHLHT